MPLLREEPTNHHTTTQPAHTEDGDDSQLVRTKTSICETFVNHPCALSKNVSITFAVWNDIIVEKYLFFLFVKIKMVII